MCTREEIQFTNMIKFGAIGASREHHRKWVQIRGRVGAAGAHRTVSF